MTKKVIYMKTLRKLFLIPAILCTILITATGCSILSSFTSTEKVQKEDPIVEPEKPIVEEEIKGPTSPYTGEEITEEGNIAYMAVIENSDMARPQSGLTDADIVFETMAEGGIPRFIALFHSKNSDIIGPIRSARPYFLDLSVEYNLPFAHCGGSADALDSISKGIGMSLNEFKYGSYYWRDSSRKAPHNLYTSSEKLKAVVEKLGYVKTPSSSLTFDDSYWTEKPHTPGQNVLIKANNNYNTAYSYRDDYYYKTMNGKDSSDRETGEIIRSKNIVIQITDIETRGDSRLNIRLTGEGEGYLFSKGSYEKIHWKKSQEGTTELFDLSGNKIPLGTGNTWWHIVAPSFNITIS